LKSADHNTSFFHIIPTLRKSRQCTRRFLRGHKSHLCDLRSCLPLQSHPTRGGHSFCGSPDDLVVGRRHHAHRPCSKGIWHSISERTRISGWSM